MGATLPSKGDSDITRIADLGSIHTIAVIDDHKLLAETVAGLLRISGVTAQTIDPVSPDQIVADVIDLGPDIVLIDYSLGGAGAATPIIRELAATDVPVIVVTGNVDPLVHGEVLEAGAAGLVVKGAPIEDLIAALVKIDAGERLVDDSTRHALISDLRKHRSGDRRVQARFDQLTPRESDVLMHICDGLAAAEIAEACFVSLATVRSQIRSILLKLDVTSQLAAAADAHRSGWVDRLRADSSNLPMAGGSR